MIGIIAISAYKLTTKSVGRDRLLWTIYLVGAVVTIVTESEWVSLFLVAGVLVWLIKAPYFKKHGKHPGIVAFVDGVTAAAIGTFTGAVVVIGKRSITDVPTALLALVTVALIFTRQAPSATASWNTAFATSIPTTGKAAVAFILDSPLVDC